MKIFLCGVLAGLTIGVLAVFAANDKTTTEQIASWESENKHYNGTFSIVDDGSTKTGLIKIGTTNMKNLTSSDLKKLETAVHELAWAL